MTMQSFYTQSTLPLDDPHDRDAAGLPVSTRQLVHRALCPFSRTVRLALSEKDLPFELIDAAPVQQAQLLRLSPSGRLPVCVEEHGRVLLSEAQPIVEYYEDMGLGRPLLPIDPYLRARARCTVRFIEDVFFKEAIDPLLTERVWKRLSGEGYPDGRAIRTAAEALRVHLRNFSLDLEQNNVLVGETMSIADLTAAAHISTVDFLGDVPWDDPNEAQRLSSLRVWYARIKSRKSFRLLLRDTVRGFTPPDHYADPDF